MDEALKEQAEEWCHRSYGVKYHSWGWGRWKNSRQKQIQF